MVKKNRQGFKIGDPRRSVDLSQLTRPVPVFDNVSKREREKINLFAKQYMKFQDNVRISPEVVKETALLVEKLGSLEDKLIINDDQTAFSLIRPGKKSMMEGIRIIYAHNDSPCLKAKVSPARFEWDPDDQNLHTGVELDTINYGGIHPHQWTGRSLEVRGWSIIDGKRKKIQFPVYSPETAAHTDTRLEEETEMSEAHLHETLDLDTGYRNVKDFLKSIGLRGEEDFARSRLYAVPLIKSAMFGQGYITGYGHDDRAGVFTAVRALLDSKKVPDYTTMIFGFDIEEIGSAGPGGADDKFFERVLHQTLIENEEVGRLEDITEALKLEIASKSLAIAADVEFAATTMDLEEGRIDPWNIAKFGYGASINCSDGIMGGDQISPQLIDSIISPLKNKNNIFQLTGGPMIADFSSEIISMNNFFSWRGYPTINIGVPTGSMHSVEELIHSGDLYHTYKLYKTILNDF
ncbi:hypothetical protein HN865_01805 [Candidatus Woesearchaeota archaeon]|jgi:aspartyl aminopeptidase|nr:hypothetical protein [Candidatus Woesearchaeota archaeon]MBT7237570.1 hypothetical protein [Candidatus Woesearchaeota archaeon]